jgi:pimeloyl-ACP methyl ester carboxylesterase
MTLLQVDPPGTAIGTVVLLHGFARSPEHLGLLSSACVAVGARTLRPALGSLWWPTSTNNAAHLDRVGESLRQNLAPGPVVVVGHSAGAAAGAWLAAGLLAAGATVPALVMVDGVESPSGLIRRAWPRLAGISVRAVCAPPSRCNRQGALASWLAGQDGDVEVMTIEGSGHGDIEGPSQAIYRWACGDDAKQPAGERVRAAVMARVVSGLGGPTTQGQ